MTDLIFKKEIELPRDAVYSAIEGGLLFRETGVLSSTFNMAFRVGGKYSFEWASGGRCHGEFLEIVPNEKVVFTWLSVGCAGETVDDTLVTVTLAEKNSNTLLTLVHSGISNEPSREGHTRGWSSSIDDFAVKAAKHGYSVSEQILVTANPDIVFASIAVGKIFDLTGAETITFCPQEGVPFELRFGERGTIKGQFERWDQPRLIKLSWNVSGFGRPDEKTEVQISVTPSGNDFSELRVEHRFIHSEDSRLAKQSAWREILAAMSMQWTDMSPANIELFGRPYNRTDNVQWTLEELGVSYKYRILDIFGLEHRKPEFRAQYGLARVPFVKMGEQVIFESGAIMLFLAERFRHRHELLPARDTAAYAETLQWLFFANSTLEAADENLPTDSEPAPFPPLIDVLAFLDTHLSGKEFIAAGRFTIADIALANTLKYVFNHVADFPNLMRYFQHHTERPAYQKIKSQPDYPKGRL